MPSDDGTKLLGEIDYPKDNHPRFTLLVSFINSAQSPEATFDKLEAATEFYNSSGTLDYAPLPLPYTSSYNSNSFAKMLN